MKKIYIAFVLFLTTVSAGAQQYYPLLDSAVNEWSYATQWLGVEPSALTASPCSYPYMAFNAYKHYTAGDTIIDSLSYKTVMNSDGLCSMGYLREDTAARKVYFIDNQFGPEVLLYDFSMQPGNQVSISFTAVGQYPSGTYTLDSITQVLIGAGPRRAFHLRDHSSSGNPTLTWVESVGSLIDVIYPYSVNQNSGGYFQGCPGNQHQLWQFLICFSHSSVIYLDSCSHAVAASMPIQTYYVDSCSYSSFIGSVNELSSISSVAVFPNPSREKTTITLDVKCADEFILVLHDVTGRQVVRRIALGMLAPGQKTIDLDLAGLSDGLYAVEIRSREGSIYSKLIIQH